MASHVYYFQLQETALKNLRVALETNPSDNRANIIYADTLTLLFEGIARVIEIHHPLIETYYGLYDFVMQLIGCLHLFCVVGLVLAIVQEVQNFSV